MIVLLVILIIVFTVLYVLSKDKYGQYIMPVDKKRYPLKQLLCIGLYVLDIINFKYDTKYNRKLLTKISEISGAKYSYYYLQIHWANKIVYLFIGILMISFVGTGSQIDAGFAVFGFALLGGIFYFSDNELDQRIKKRRMIIRTDFPDFLNRLILLINAGMTISKAWEKVVMDNKKESILYEELRLVLTDIKGGMPEHRAYENFAKRCRTPEVTRVVSVILQNLRKGSSDIVSLLRIYANDCWEMRKSTARKLGEEASTKMLLPMMLMFFAILLIVATPAVLALRGI